MIGGDFVAGARGMKVNGGILCRAKRRINWAKDDGKVGGNKVSQEESL